MTKLLRQDQIQRLAILSKELDFMSLSKNDEMLLNSFSRSVPKFATNKPSYFANRLALYQKKKYCAQFNHIIAKFYIKALVFMRVGRASRALTLPYATKIIWSPANLVPMPHQITQSMPEFNEWGKNLDLLSLITSAIGLAHAWCQEILAPQFPGFKDTTNLSHMRSHTGDFGNGQVMGVFVQNFSEIFLKNQFIERYNYNIFVIRYVQVVLARTAYIWGIVQAGICGLIQKKITIPNRNQQYHDWWEVGPDGQHLFTFTRAGFNKWRSENTSAALFARKFIIDCFGEYFEIWPDNEDVYSMYSSDSLGELPRLRGKGLTDSSIQEWMRDCRI